MFGFGNFTESKNDKIKRLEEEVESLKGDNQGLERSLVNAKDSRNEAIIELEKVEVAHKLDISRINNCHQVDEERLLLRVVNAENSVKTQVADGLRKGRKDLEHRAEQQDRAHAERMKRLEADYAAKIAKCDRELEADKASYRKYIRQENNTRIEKLEKENAALTKENITANATIASLTRETGMYDGKLNLAIQAFNDIAKALPVITANFTTPDITVLPGQSVAPKQNNGEQKKQ